MVNKILTGAGFVLNKTCKETRFLSAPDTNYAVYDDSRNCRGADYHNLIIEHDITIELYEYSPDPGAEKRIEDQLELNGLEYVKQPRYWIQEEQLYQVIYEFAYIEKKEELEKWGQVKELL